jgi:aromatic-L-amino-acid decarboxylase
MVKWPINMFTTKVDSNSSCRSLDPDDWAEFRAQSHRMLDDMVDYLESIRERPVWQPAPAQARSHFQQPLPTGPSSLADAHASFMTDVLPYAVGNAHPRFMGWVHGGGTPVGMVADMLAAGLNANVGGRDQMPVEVERQIVRWMRQLFGFPESASGIFVTGTSMANFMAVLVARTSFLGGEARQAGLHERGRGMVAYTSVAAHGCIAKAMDMSGLGSAALRRIPVNDRHQIDLAALEQSIAEDRRQGLQPFMIAGTAGTVDAGAVDDLAALADIAGREQMWFHIDGAYAALGMLAPDVAPLLAGIERADSLAFDFHKWGQVPYDAGFLLVRDGVRHVEAFSSPAAYLQREARGLAAGSPWPCDFGPDLSRGFRALKTWFTFKVLGAEAIGKSISETCRLARYLGERIGMHPELELMAPIALNIVCFRYRSQHPDRINRDIVGDLHESGIAAPSTTIIGGTLAIRAAIVNHRTQAQDIDALLDAVLAFGAARSQ